MPGLCTCQQLCAYAHCRWDLAAEGYNDMSMHGDRLVCSLPARSSPCFMLFQSYALILVREFE